MQNSPVDDPAPVTRIPNRVSHVKFFLQLRILFYFILFSVQPMALVVFEGPLGQPQPVSCAGKFYFKWHAWLVTCLALAALQCFHWKKLLNLWWIWWSGQHLGIFPPLGDGWTITSGLLWGLSLGYWNQYVSALTTQEHQRPHQHIRAQMQSVLLFKGSNNRFRNVKVILFFLLVPLMWNHILPLPYLGFLKSHLLHLCALNFFWILIILFQ